MQVFLAAPFAVIFLGLITWIALSKKSGPLLRRAAIAALVLIGLSVIISLILLFSGPGAAAGPPIAVLPEEPVQPEKEGSAAVLIFAFPLLAFLVLIIFISLRREKRRT